MISKDCGSGRKVYWKLDLITHGWDQMYIKTCPGKSLMCSSKLIDVNYMFECEVFSLSKLYRKKSQETIDILIWNMTMVTIYLLR